MDDTKKENIKESVQNDITKNEIINTLIDRNDTAKWINDTLMKKMDKYAYFRSLLLLCFFGFFLGNNLGIFLWLYIIVTIYLIIYRIARFWVKRRLMYLIEFCYFGNTLLICYILFFGNSQEAFYTVFYASTGVMALAVIIFNNQAHFNSTDHLTSSYVHTFPILTVWAIRWRHKLYAVDTSIKYFSLLQFNESGVISGSVNSEPINIYILHIYPLLFWLIWATIYFILNSTVFSYYMVNPKYGTGVQDFLEFSSKLKFIFGDLKKNTLIKYLLQHFSLFVITLPICWLCYNYYIINSIYVVLIMIYLSWNSGRNNMRNLEKKLIKHEFKSNVEENL